MSQLKGMLFYYSVNMRYALLIFWSILLGIMAVSLLFDLILGEKTGQIYFSFGFPLYLFAMVTGFWVVKNVIPYLVRMGITRTNIYIGTGLVFVLLALFNGAAANTLQFIVTNVFGGSIGSPVEITMNGKDIIDSGGMIGLFAEDTWWNHFVVDVSVQFICVAVSFFFGLVFYRYKLIGGALLIGALLIALTYSITSGWLGDTIMNLWENFSMVFFYQLFLSGLFIYLLTIVPLKRLTV